MVAKNPSDRYSSAAEWVEALERGKAGAEAPAQRPEGAIGDAGHGRQYEPVGKRVRADLHGGLVVKGRTV